MIFSNKDVKLFIKHNKKYFFNNFNSKKEILVEFNKWPLMHILLSYLCYYFSKKNNAIIKAYPGYNFFLDNGIKRYFISLIWGLANFISFGTFKIYKSFGVKHFFLPKINNSQKKKVDKIFLKLNKTFITKEYIINLKINNIYIGDLIYNSYYHDFREGVFSLSFNSKEFRDFLYNSISLFIFWYDYLKKGSVQAILLIHSSYLPAINLRIALKFNINIFSASPEKLYRFKKNNLHPWHDFKNYRKKFNMLSKKQQENGLKLSKKYISYRFKGDNSHFDIITKFNPFKDKQSSFSFPKKKRIRILVAAHCFYDSPFLFGKTFFSDFHDWLNFLGNASEKTDYDWYIKTHNYFRTSTRVIIESFVGKFKKFKLLPENITHNEIYSNIDVVLSVYGTIGWEYAYLGIPVINASRHNPHVKYNFNIIPQNLLEYKKIIFRLNKNYLNNFKINKKEILEYYFMNYIHFKKKWLVEKLEEKKSDKLLLFLKDKNSFQKECYTVWVKAFKEANHNNILKNIDKFFLSGDTLYLDKEIFTKK
jgi:hypothetical protein